MIHASEDTAKRFALALAGAAIISPIAFPAAAQQVALTPEQCRNAISISSSIMEKYRGRISEKFANSLGRFRDTGCDLNTQFTRVDGTKDNEAFGEFRLLLVALRTAAISKPAALAQK